MNGWMNGLLCTVLFMGWCAAAQAEELDPAEMERLGKLSGEVMLHAAVLKRLDVLCPRGAEGDYTGEIERDVKKMTEDFQAAFSLQLLTSQKVGDFIVRDLLKKGGGCSAERVAQARQQAEERHREGLRQWRARGR